MIINVPHDPGLFCGLDESVGHHRRYLAKDLEEKMRKAGFEIAESRQFNRFATLGWFISGKLLGAKKIKPGQMKLYNALLPIAKMMENIPIWPALSLIIVGQKPANGSVRTSESASTTAS